MSRFASIGPVAWFVFFFVLQVILIAVCIGFQFIYPLIPYFYVQRILAMSFSGGHTETPLFDDMSWWATIIVVSLALAAIARLSTRSNQEEPLTGLGS